FFATAIPLALLQLYPQNNDIELWASSILVIPMLSLLLLRRVSFQAAAWMTIGSLWLAITLSIVRYSHANGMLEITYILLIFLASILLAGRRWMFVATASVLTSTVLAFAQLSGLLHVSQHTINEKWLLALFQIGTLAAVSAFIFWNRQREKAAIQAIQVQNIELEEQRNMMEQRSAELSTSSARLQLESQQRRQSMAKLRKAEAALRTSENRYRTVFEHDPNAIIIADLLTQKIVEANGSATRLFGYRQDVIQTLSMPALSPEEQPQWVNDDADLLAMDKATFHDLSVYEWVFQKADGEQFPAEVRMVRLPTIGNSGQLFQMSIVDITERHYALRALRESEARYRTLVENAPDAIVIIDAEAQCIVEANESAALLFGKSKIELLTADIREVLPLDSADTSYNTFAEIAEATKDGGTITVEFLHTDQAGEATTLEAHLVKMPANNRRLLRASMIDVTRRRNAEDMVSAIPGCVSVLSLDGDVLWANSAFIGRFELTATNLVGVSIKQFITAEEFAFMVAALRDQTGQRNFKFIAQSVQGAEMWLTTAATVIEFKHRAAILFFVEDAETPTPTLSETTPILDGVQISAEVAQQFQELIGAILNQSTIALSKLPQHNPARSHVDKSLAAAKQFANLGRNTIGEPKAAKISVTNIAVNTLLTDNDGLFALTIPPHLSIEYALEPALPEIHADL
ncbi:MAG TPA: PAS domain S-box protein, partial [Anaerolineae bacterium]|nr:PAS domain S-box protein [Anaerolineae bacterium]